MRWHVEISLVCAVPQGVRCMNDPSQLISLGFGQHSGKVAGRES